MFRKSVMPFRREFTLTQHRLMTKHITNARTKSHSVYRNKNRVQSVERAIRILHTFSPNTPKWGVTRLSHHLHLPKTIVLRLLETLEDAGFVEQDHTDRTYYLGRSIYELAGTYASHNELIRISHSFLQDLVGETGFTSQLAIRDGLEVMSLLAVESPMVVRAVFHPGLRRPIHATATGKVLLSALSDETVKTLLSDTQLPAITSKTITEVEELIKQLNAVRHQGYALNFGESIVGLTAIAAPIRNYLGQVVAGVSIGFPSQFVSRDQIPILTKHVLATAQKISRRLGARSEFR